MRAAFSIRAELGLVPEIEELAAFALTQLADGDAAALETADTLLRRSQRAADNTVWPFYCYWAAARVYRRFGDRRAAKTLALAVDQVGKHSAAVGIAEWQREFAALHVVRAIRTAAERDVWP